MTTSASPPPAGSTAFFIQAAISFVVSSVGVAAGVVYLPVSAWVRAFLALGLLYVITSTFTLAKCVRDRQENQAISSRVDQARLDKLLAEHDPYATPTLCPARRRRRRPPRDGRRRPHFPGAFLACEAFHREVLARLLAIASTMTQGGDM